ncbi:MAG: imm11 family protein [Planctomycetaceae bacterium]
MERIYECRPSDEDTRPTIDFDDERHCAIDWLTIAEVIDGALPLDSFPSVSLHVARPDATQWDCYMDGGVRGIFSRRFVNAVGSAAFNGVELLPANLNDEIYFFIRCVKPIDCLDRSKSIYESFHCDPQSIKAIRHYAFRSEAVPEDSCFVLPELPTLLVTDSVFQRIRAAGLKGISIKCIS